MIDWLKSLLVKQEQKKMERSGLNKVLEGANRKKEVAQKIFESFEDRRIPPRMTVLERRS